MAKRRDYQLNKDELADLEQAIRHDVRPEVRLRGLGIRQLHLGHPAKAIAEMHAVSKPTVYGWWKRWCASGVEGLANQPKSGRPPKWDEAYLTQVELVVEKEPTDLGYGFAIWTIDRLRLHLAKASGLELSETAFRALLKKQGFRYRPPKYDLGHLQDPEAEAPLSFPVDADRVPCPYCSTENRRV
jgi:transposase